MNNLSIQLPDEKIFHPFHPKELLKICSDELLRTLVRTDLTPGEISNETAEGISNGTPGVISEKKVLGVF